MCRLTQALPGFCVCSALKRSTRPEFRQDGERTDASLSIQFLVAAPQPRNDSQKSWGPPLRCSRKVGATVTPKHRKPFVPTPCHDTGFILTALNNEGQRRQH
jgi:hypothetical protein